MEVCGRQIRVEGGGLRIARLAADGYEFLADPAAMNLFRGSKGGLQTS